MEGKVRAAEKEAQKLVIMKAELKDRTERIYQRKRASKNEMDAELESLKERKKKLGQDMELADSSWIGADQVLQILRGQLKNLLKNRNK